MPILADFHGTFEDHPEIRGDVDAIVTGTSYQTPFEVFDVYEGPQLPIFFNPISKDKLTLIAIVNHKAHVINSIKASKYYENDTEQASMLEILCPETRIVLVSEGRTTI